MGGKGKEDIRRSAGLKEEIPLYSYSGSMMLSRR